MTAWAYYNEIDPFAAAWLRELMKDNLIAPGEVDERSIEDVTPDDVRSFRQCHFFAGIGVWSVAARLAGWEDDTPLWSGSCPCQPFSAAGKGGGFDDERHVWPAFHYLIEQCDPPLAVGEQVAGADGDAWFDLVSADLDATGYGFGVAETVAAGFGAPHIRTRNYWVAHRIGARLEGLAGDGDDRDQSGRIGTDEVGYAAAGGAPSRLADFTGEGRGRPGRDGGTHGRTASQSGRLCDARGLGNAGGDGAGEHARKLSGDESQHEERPTHGDHAPVDTGAAMRVANAEHDDGRADEPERGQDRGAADSGMRGSVRLADADGVGSHSGSPAGGREARPGAGNARDGEAGRLDDTHGERQRWRGAGHDYDRQVARGLNARRSV